MGNVSLKKNEKESYSSKNDKHSSFDSWFTSLSLLSYYVQ